jgi:hypothetical protein
MKRTPASQPTSAKSALIPRAHQLHRVSAWGPPPSRVFARLLAPKANASLRVSHDSSRATSFRRVFLLDSPFFFSGGLKARFHCCGASNRNDGRGQTFPSIFPVERPSAEISDSPYRSFSLAPDSPATPAERASPRGKVRFSHWPTSAPVIIIVVIIAAAAAAAAAAAIIISTAEKRWTRRHTHTHTHIRGCT